MHAQLVPLRGGEPIAIQRDLTLVGRQEDLCDFVIDVNSISKLHCLIARTDGLLFIRDLGSTNGTKVNGQKVTRGALLPGDELSFAGERYRVEMGPDLPEVPVGAQTEAIAEFVSLPEDEDAVALDGDMSLDEADDYLDDEDRRSDVRFLDDSRT